MSSHESIILEKLNLLIDENINKSVFSLDNLGKELGISRTQLHRILKEQTHLSPSLYIRKRRLDRANTLLSTTKLRISEISDAVGIDSPQNFSKYFTQEFGINPTEFRKNHVAIEEENITQATDNEIVIENILVPKKQKIYTYLWAGLGVLTIVIVGLYFWQKSTIYLSEKKEDSNNLLDFSENSVAILPFKNLGKTENVFFSDGVMEQIHGSLSLFENLKVISKTSSRLFKDTKKSSPQIANELRVKYLLEGSVLQIDDKIRITIDLTNAKEDRSVWTKSYDGDAKDIFVYMSKVAKEVAGELNQKMSSGIADRIDKIPTKNTLAYNEYLQGKYLIQTRVKEKLQAGLIKFDKATDLDPKFADAFASKALTYFLLSEDGYADVQTVYKMAEKNALIALRFDAENAMAYGVLANIYKAQNKWEQAVTSFQIALKFNPNDAQINYWYSLTIRSIGLMDEAIKYSTKAVSLDPLAHNIYGGHIIGCVYAGRFDLAEKAIKEGELIFNNSHLFHNAKAFYQIIHKNYEEALNEFKMSETLSSKNSYFSTMVAYCQAKLGQNAAVQLHLNTLPKIPDNYKYVAIVYAGLGNKDLCLKYLSLAADINDSPNYLKVSPLFEFLHNDVRFDDILQKLGLLNPAISSQ